VIGIEEDFTRRTFRILVGDAIAQPDEAKLVAFVENLGLPLPTAEVVVTEPSSEAGVATAATKRLPDLPMRIRAPRARPTAPAFVRADDQFWFENLNAAATGVLSPDRFPGLEPGAFRCFADFTVGRHLNLRQSLLLYDQIYCSLPLAEEHNAFLAHQGLTEDDLLTLVVAGRLKIVSTQPEERLRLPFLEAVAERRPDAIMGRRAAALLLLADVAQTADRYRLRDPVHYPALRELSEAIAPSLGLTPPSLLRGLLWPLNARRRSLQGLLEEGSKRGPALHLAEILAEAAPAENEVGVRLTAMGLSERTHLAHAMNATVLGALGEPPGCVALMAALGHELNFYRSFNTAIASAWAANERRKANGVTILPPIPVFDFQARVPITEFLAEASLASTRAQGRALMARLAELPEDARGVEIDALADQLRTAGRRRDGAVMTFDNLDTAVAVASILMAFVYPPLAGLWKGGQVVLDRLRRVPAIDKMVQAMAEDTVATFGSNQDLPFLSKVQRVAQLKQPRV
jgi:hypothetical protein